ncbi:hypothetical protein HN51_006631 [Arachis hypogaea]
MAGFDPAAIHRTPRWGYNRGRHGGRNCGGAMAGCNEYGGNSGPSLITPSFASCSKKNSLSLSLCSHLCNPEFPLFVSVLSSLQPRFLHQPSSIAAVSRAARRAAQRAARLCSLNTAAHHLLTLLYTMSTSRQALDSNVPTPASAGSTVGAAPVGPAPAAPIRSNRVTQAGNILVQ